MRYCGVMDGAINIRTSLRRLGVCLVVLAALVLPIAALAAVTPIAHDCVCGPDQNKACPVQMNCGLSCPGFVQLPGVFVYLPLSERQPGVLASAATAISHTFRPALPPPRF